MDRGLIINGIRSVNPMDLGSLNCFEASLKCSYSECKRRLHRVILDLLAEGKLATYELVESSEGPIARIYIRDRDILNHIKNAISDFLKGELKGIGSRTPSYSAIEVFFDLLVNVAFRRANFRYIKKGKMLDPSDFSKYVKKRTIIEVAEEGDSEKYYGVLFIDYGVISRSSLAEELLEKLEIDDFTELRDNEDLKMKSLDIANSYIGTYVLTLMKHGSRYEYVYGKIAEIEPVFSQSKSIPGCQTIYNLWVKRFRESEVVRHFVEIEPSPWEYPLFKVRFEGYGEELTYPPSLLRVFGAVERPDPSTRWDNIVKITRIVEENIKKIYKDLTGKDIKFRYIKYSFGSSDVGIRLNFYTGSDDEKPFRKYVVRLKYKDDKGEEKPSHASPLFMFSKGAMPYGGKQKLSLLVVYPSTVSSTKLSMFIDYLVSLFEELNFGNIDKSGCEYYSYKYDPANLSESLTSLEATLGNALQRHKHLEYLPLILIPDNENFYKSSKEAASSRGFHSQLVTLETFDTATDYIIKIKDSNLPDDTRQMLRKALRSLVANICGGIYVEFLIQKNVAEHRISGPLTWILAKPADKKGESMYVGLDISTKKGVAGVAFILLNPYGELVDAKNIQLKSESLSYQDYYDILRYTVSKARDRGLKRIVILRDGIPRSHKELRDCANTYNSVVKELKYEVSLDYVAVIKNSHVRAFAISSDKAAKLNPIQGTYAYLYKLKHLGYYAHEVLVIASKPEESEEEGSGTTRPVVLRIYELQRKYRKNEVMKIGKEYLALTRLDFWNLKTGAHRLALPIRMADTLAYMLSIGIPVKMS